VIAREIPKGGYQGRLVARYQDVAGNNYTLTAVIDTRGHAGERRRGMDHAERVARALEDIKIALERYR
jgi:hypothetical protein